MLKICILARDSTQVQDYDRQINELTAYASSHQMEVVKIFANKVSGAKKNEERTEIQELISFVKSERIDKVLVLEISRLGRNTLEALKVIELLNDHKICLFVKNYNIETLDSQGNINPMAQFLITILLEVSRMERTTIKQRMESGYKPRDKSLVEGAVKILYRRIYAVLKDETFFSVSELNNRISDLLDAHNMRKLTGRPYSRLQLYDELEKDKLSALPARRFEIKYQALATVMQNCHVQLGCDKHFYSVPYQYIRKKVKILYTRTTVEVYYKYNRLATHPRNYTPYTYTTNAEHLASTHQFITDWTAPRFIDWANSIDPVVGQYIFRIIESRNHPEQAFKSCMGILSFEKKVGKQRLANACKRAIDFGSYSFKTIQNILENNLDMIGNELLQDTELPQHNNIRGKNYYK